MVHGDLPLEPFGQLRHALLELDPRLVPEQLARAGDVGEAVPDVARPVPPDDLGLDVDAEDAREALRDLDHRRGAAVFGQAMAMSVVLMAVTALAMLAIDRFRAGTVGQF